MLKELGTSRTHSAVIRCLTVCQHIPVVRKNHKNQLTQQFDIICCLARGLALCIESKQIMSLLSCESATLKRGPQLFPLTRVVGSDRTVTIVVQCDHSHRIQCLQNCPNNIGFVRVCLAIVVCAPVCLRLVAPSRVKSVKYIACRSTSHVTEHCSDSGTFFRRALAGAVQWRISQQRDWHWASFSNGRPSFCL